MPDDDDEDLIVAQLGSYLIEESKPKEVSSNETHKQEENKVDGDQDKKEQADWKQYFNKFMKSRTSEVMANLINYKVCLTIFIFIYILLNLFRFYWITIPNMHYFL